MKLSGICMIFLLIIAGCATVASNRKPGVDFAQYRKIAVIEFQGPNQAVSREVTNRAAMEFSKKGYDVVQGTVQAGKNAGVKALIQGTVSKYECRDSSYMSGSYIPVASQTCEVSLSMKMLDAMSGDILWSANSSLSLGKADGPEEVLQQVLTKISETIP